MVIFGGTGALGVVFAAHHIENATPRSIVSTSVILASRSGRGSTLGRVFASRASPFVVRACAANAVSVDGASRIVPRDARAWIHAGGALLFASVDAIAHGATRIVTSAKRSAAIQRRRRPPNSRRRRSSRIFPPSRRSSGPRGKHPTPPRTRAWLDGRAGRRSRSGVPTVAAQWGPWGGAGMATRDSTLRARLSRKGFGFLAPEDGVAALRAAIEVATASTELRFQPVVCVARAVWWRLAKNAPKCRGGVAAFLADVVERTGRIADHEARSTRTPTRVSIPSRPNRTRVFDRDCASRSIDRSGVDRG